MRAVVSQQHQLTGSKSSLFDKIIKNKQNKEMLKCDTVDHASSSFTNVLTNRCYPGAVSSKSKGEAM
jgi:hypothetical protein